MINKVELVERAIEASEEFHGVEELSDDQLAETMAICDEIWEYILNELNIDGDPEGEECYDS